MPANTPGPIPKEALAFFRAKGFKVGFDHRDVWRQEHATAFTVAKAMTMDILTAIRGSVDNALEMGMTYREYSQQLTPLLQKLGWWGKQEMIDPSTGDTVTAQLGSPRRLKTIYDANLRTARSAGQWDRGQQSKKTHPYFVYELGPSENHRPEHVAWAGIMLPVDHPWWDTHFPTNGYGCKCRVRQVSRREYDTLNNTGRYLTEPPATKTMPWLNKRTGEVEQVPVGIDPGWDTNPGKIGREAQAKKQLAEKKTRFEHAVKQPLPNPPLLYPAGTNAVLSTVKGVTQGSINDLLQRIPGASDQVAQLAQFIAAHPIKAIFVKAEEMGRSKKAWALADDVGTFLGAEYRYKPIQAYTTRGINQTGGFTHPGFEHVTIKVMGRDKLATVDAGNLPQLVTAAIEQHNGKPGAWAVPYAIKTLSDGPVAILPAWAHEMGHQLHYWANRPARPVNIPAISKYAAQNSEEWHAETFTAWLLNRQALAAWNPEAARYIDDLIKSATASKVKR